MRRIVFISFGNDRFIATLERIIEEARSSHFFDECIGYTPKDFDSLYWNKYQTYYEKNNRGFGFWIWKSYFIIRTLRLLKENDILVYLDSGCEINRYGFFKFREYLKQVEQADKSIVAFQNGYLERQWTKGDVIDFFSVREREDILDSEQIMGGVMMIRNCDQSRELLNKWFEIVHSSFCLVTDEDSKSPNMPDFKENRHDQSVFSLLCKTNNGVKILPREEVDPQCWDSEFWHDTQYLLHPFIISRSRNGISKYSKSKKTIIICLYYSCYAYCRVKLGSWKQKIISLVGSK